MDKMYISAKGEIGTLNYWQTECDIFWAGLGPIKDLERNGFKRPDDAFDRMVRVFKLEEYNHGS